MCNPLSQMQIRLCRTSNTFGMVRNQGKKPHQGWDLAARVGTPVYAIRSGRIVEVRDHGDYGKQVTLEFTHVGQTAYAFYAHLEKFLCKQGDPVRDGDVIATSGRSGNAWNLPMAEEHLHFEIRLWLQRPGKGLVARIDPGEVLGYETYSTPKDPLRLY